MSDTVSAVPPEKCISMAEVRAGVDAVDQALVALLVKRFGYMDAAARIKDQRAAVRDEARKLEVLNNVKAAALASGLPEEPIVKLWDLLVESSIAYELEQWNANRN